MNGTTFGGLTDIEDLLETLRNIEKEIVIFHKIINTFLHESALEILVFPKQKFEDPSGGRIENIRFLGLAIIHMHMMQKYRSQYHVGLNDFGWIKGKAENIAGRFSFGKSSDNYLEKDSVEKEKKRATLTELINEINKRKKNLGIK